MAEHVRASNVELYSEIMRDQANAIFESIDRFLNYESDRNVPLWRKNIEPIANDQVSREATEVIEQQHLISYVVFRCIRDGNGDIWELENITSNVDIAHLDHIRLTESFQGYSLHTDPDEEANVKTAMAENPNFVLLRTILDWSREDGNVWSEQITWSGGFEECERLAHLLDIGNTNTPSSSSSIRLRTEYFDLHSESRNLFISLQETHPVAATISLIDSWPTVDISRENDGIGDSGGLLCAICLDKLRFGETAKQMPCNHLFHDFCIFQWFSRRLVCPLCRKEFHNPA